MERALLVSAVLLVACESTPAPAPAAAPVEPIRVAAASDLAIAFKEVAAEVEKSTGRPVKLTFGSSGLMSKQIMEGAPFDLYASANEAFVDDVIRAQKCSPETKAVYAQGRIAIWTKGNAPASLAELADPKFAKIAIANPEHAPYGAAAKDALERAGVWNAVKPKLVFGENVQQTLQFAQSGNAEAAIVALSLAIVAQDGKHTLVDAAEHRPLIQVLVACGSGAGFEGAKAFATYVNSADGRAIMRRYGFFLPGEAAAQK